MTVVGAKAHGTNRARHGGTRPNIPSLLQYLYPHPVTISTGRQTYFCARHLHQKNSNNNSITAVESASLHHHTSKTRSNSRAGPTSRTRQAVHTESGMRAIAATCTLVVAALGSSSAQRTTQDVEVDLTPCIFSAGPVVSNIPNKHTPIFIWFDLERIVNCKERRPSFRRIQKLLFAVRVLCADVCLRACLLACVRVHMQ